MHNSAVKRVRYGKSVGLFPGAESMELASGAPGRDDSGLDAGEARVFRLAGSSWIMAIEQDGFGAGDENGTAVARPYRATL